MIVNLELLPIGLYRKNKNFKLGDPKSNRTFHIVTVTSQKSDIGIARHANGLGGDSGGGDVRSHLKWVFGENVNWTKVVDFGIGFEKDLECLAREKNGFSRKIRRV